MELFPEHFKKDRFLSTMDARIKILVVIALLIMIISYREILFPLVVIHLCLLLRAMLKIPLKLFVARLSEPLFIVAVVFILKLFFSGRIPLFSINIFGFEIAAYQEGLIEGLIIGSRIIAAVSVLVIMGFCTPFTEFMAGLSWLRVPKGFIEIMVFTYRYIFLLLDEGMAIYHAQKTRLGYSSLRRRFRSFGILTGSLILKAFEHSQYATEAMVQRGYDGHIPMTTGRALKTSETLSAMMFTVMMGLLWMI